MCYLGRNFVFIHVYKTGGMSVRWLLRGGKRIGSKHQTASDAKSFLGARWDSLFSFGFVRNPFTWMVSLYEYIRRENDNWEHAQVSKMSFPAFLEYHRKYLGTRDLRPGEPRHYYTMTEALCDESRVPLVSLVGRFERFEQDVRDICKRLNVFAPMIPRSNVGNYRSVSEYYADPACAEIVRDTLAVDFEVFGYDKGLPWEQDVAPAREKTA